MMNVVAQPSRPVATFLLFVGITLYATVSSSLLVTLGIPYDIPGGNFLFKIHPGTYVLGLAYLAVMVPGNPVRILVSDMVRFPAWLFFGIVVALLIVYSALTFGLSEAAFIPETLLVPLIVAQLMSHLPVAARANAFLWTIALLAINAAIAIWEGLTKTHLVPYLISGKLAHEEMFRATALGGHPLANALVTATFLFAGMLLLRRAKVIGILIIFLFGLALLAFGGRVAFTVSVTVGSLWLVLHMLRTMFTPTASLARKTGLVILSFVIIGGGIALVVASGLGGRIFQGFQMDSSARSRFALFNVFTLVDAIEFMFGVGPDGIERLMRTLRFTSGLTATIENFWVLWILNFGAIGFLAVTTTLSWFFRTLLRGAPTAILLATLVFVITASGNNSLATKNKGLAYLVIAIMGGRAYATRLAARERPHLDTSLAHRPALAAARVLPAVLVAVLAGALVAGALTMASPSAIAAEAAEPALKRGVNLSHWLQYERRQPIVAADLSALRARGFDHVRLPFDPAQFGWRAERGGEGGASWGGLDRGVAAALDAGLAVILDFHPSAADKAAIETNADAQSAFIAAWRDFAVRYRAIPADRLVFELLNEPDFDRGGAAAANDLKRRTINAIREVDPSRVLLLASIYAKGTVDQLKANELVRDSRVLYVFHFYDPHIFTHFGATWGSYSRPPYTLIQTIRYPASHMDRNALDVFDRPGKERAVQLLGEYVDERWNAGKVEKEIAAIAAWARDNKVRVICTEFGVLRTRVDAESRLNWLRDARTSFERHGIPWSMWDYADIFGIATATGEVRSFSDGAVTPLDKANPRRQFDDAALRALGLGVR